ncbi:LPS export ABC transporter ATP-binding protein [Oscillatoriales cyanobacterium LEGE 11467]|uniref:LPS export ABC transporter ATP-binding protein n=1 Tax=Zarconia navalis LEGE 11467 TaxID=1828826 RepID=A0A928Z7S8_9CYAN|nr:LPS export ABC transporter ATP-binding protein [Zarconia navalis]MBE9039789.1 LPS export ABC transporter ATP-binding protein [Zarconia navalis LEGE 11467]
MRISLENVHKSYNKRTVVNRVNVSVSQGEIVGLLGPNGAGKTTTFGIVTGLVKPDRGRVWLNEREITHLPMHKRSHMGIGYLAQDPSIFRNLSIRDNLLLVLEQTRVPYRQRAQRLQDLLGEFHLEKVASTLGTQVSGGERRRAELARSLVVGCGEPLFLLLDEPFSGIDPIVVAEIQQFVAKLRDRGMGILITDHNVRETLEITDRAYIMREGEILASGSPEELYDNPLVRQYYLGQKFQR